MSKKKRKNDFEPPYDGFFTSSVASANDSTGYAVTIPDTEEQAKALSLVGHTEFTRGKDSGKRKKNRK